MSKIKITCLMCFKKIEAEPGVESTCPHCGASFCLKPQEELDKMPKSEPDSELSLFHDLVNKLYDYEEQKDYENMITTAKEVLDIEEEIFEGWAYLAIGEAGLVEKLMQENQPISKEKIEEINTYFENALEFSLLDKEIEKLKPIQEEFIKKVEQYDNFE